ncbi:transglutaminase domain-containing protein [Lujinxingia sediminis]|uniref:Transglutaminase domain-containing protein n=1 Tax=Lujinxingia sediminis TaxID=2480984 RepID=A0ABY0CXA7_9DELT|nr:transglutaminase domain-containing protein [Lujinxingia sediminis]RVU48265.1 transglutaminase domain-containing protein [Lujinxingia sediminis]
MRETFLQTGSPRGATLIRAFIIMMWAVWAAPLAAQEAAEGAQAPALSPTELGVFKARISELRRQARTLQQPDAHASPLTLDEALNQIPRPHSPGNIYRWVRDTIAFEPYTGALRGVQGTLIAGSANAVDQALLTRELLRRSGHTTRFATGRLHDSDIREVLTRLASSARVERRGEAVAAREPGLDAALIARLRDHIWVEVEQRGEFIAVDPIAAPLVGMTPARAQAHHEQLPEDWTTTLEVELSSHLKDTQRISHLTVSGPLSRYAYRTLTLGFEPDSMRKQGRIPVLFVGDQSSRGQAIPIDALESLELSFRLKSGAREQRWTQTLYRSATNFDIFSFDAQHFSVTLMPGWSSDAWLARRSKTAAEAALSALQTYAEELASAAVDGEAADSLAANAVMHELNAMMPAAFIRKLDRSVLRNAHRLGVRPVLSQPRAVVTASLQRGDQVFVDLRLSGDRVDALPLGEVPAVATAAFGGLYGHLLDTLTAEFLEQQDGRQMLTVARIFRRASQQRIPFTTIDPRSIERLDALSINDTLRTRLRESIRRQGRVLLSPLHAVEVDGVKRFGWWSVEPLSGWMRAHPIDALLAQVAQHDENDPLSPPRHLDLHAELIARSLRAASSTLAPPADQAPSMCVATRELLALSRAFCATKQAIASPELEICLHDPQGGQAPISASTDMLGLAGGSCVEQLATTRCGAVYARAVAQGELVIANGETSSTTEAEATPPAPPCP